MLTTLVYTAAVAAWRAAPLAAATLKNYFAAMMKLEDCVGGTGQVEK